jgi:uncharacterized RDD family membrane protein YckC
MSAPGFFRRLASLLYDSLVSVAILLPATLLFISLFGDATQPPQRYILQVYLWLVAGIYFTWNWQRGGQTLAMQTWRIRVVNHAGISISYSQAVMRYIYASAFFGLTFLWALFDREGLYLHDRLTGSRLILTKTKANGVLPRTA